MAKFTRQEILDALVDAQPYVETDSFDWIDGDERYLTLRCYGDALEVGSTSYATLDAALNALGGGSNESPWGIIDLHADSLDRAFIPIELTARALEPAPLTTVPTPDH